MNEVPLPRPESEVLVSGEATLTLPPLRNNRRKMFRRLDSCAVPGYSPLCVDLNDPDSMACGFKARLFRDLPRADVGVLREVEVYVSKFLDARVPRARVGTYEEWREKTTYSAGRLQQLDRAYESLRGGRPSLKDASHVDTFGKTEFYQTWKHARMINSRHDRFKVWSGRYFKAIEEVVYALPEFIKHVPVCDRPAKIAALKKAGRKYFATDYKAFESHFIPAVMNVVECALYRHCLRDYPEDADYICSVIAGRNEMRTRSGIRASILGRRMSGDMCTSLGNGFTNLILTSFLVAKHGGTLEGFVEGDDGIFSTDVELLPSMYSELGFTIDIKEVADPCTASFCGMVFSGSGEIIRDPRRFMQGFGWTHSFLHAGPKIMKELLRGKALCAAVETPQCPIVGAFARYGIAVTKGAEARFEVDGYHTAPESAVVQGFNPSLDTRETFAQLYGIPIPLQLEVERAVLKGDFKRVSVLLPAPLEIQEYTARYVTVT